MACNNENIILLSDTENEFFEGRDITNHSGKVTILFNSGFDDILIRQRPAHRSDAINVYKPPSCNMLQSLSNI